MIAGLLVVCYLLLFSTTVAAQRGLFVCDLEDEMMRKMLDCVHDNAKPEVAKVLAKFQSNGALLTRALCRTGSSIDRLLDLVYPREFINELLRLDAVCKKKLLQ